MTKTGEGSAWTEYTLPALRPPSTLVEKELGFIVERAVANFLRDHAPEYRRGDITSIVIDEDPVGGGFVNYVAKVAYTKVEGEQV